jgi:phospholipase D1/2
MDSSNSETSKVKGTDENVNDKPSVITPAVDRSKKAEEPFEKWERDEMEKLLGELRGHLGECYSKLL